MITDEQLKVGAVLVPKPGRHIKHDTTVERMYTNHLLYKRVWDLRTAIGNTMTLTLTEINEFFSYIK